MFVLYNDLLMKVLMTSQRKYGLGFGYPVQSFLVSSTTTLVHIDSPSPVGFKGCFWHGTVLLLIMARTKAQDSMVQDRTVSVRPSLNKRVMDAS